MGLTGYKSTTDIFGESKYLTNIKTVPTTLNLRTIGDLLKPNKKDIWRTTGIYGITQIYKKYPKSEKLK